MWAVTCPECKLDFDSEDSVGDSQAMLREHRRLEHSVHAVLVGNEMEYQRALDAGWDRLDIIRPNLRYLQGRRWHVLHVTWGFMLIDTNEDQYYEMLSTIHSNQVMMHGDVHIVNMIPNRKELNG